MSGLAVNALEANTLLFAFAPLPLAAAFVWALAAIRIRRGRPAGAAWRDSTAEVGAVVGSIPLLFLGLTPRDGDVVVQLVPFVDLADLAAAEPRVIVEQLAGNLLILAAAGFFLPIRFRLGLGTIAIGAALACTAIETLQYVFVGGRVVSIDDVMLNTFGAVLAALVSRRWWRVRSPDGRTHAAAEAL